MRARAHPLLRCCSPLLMALVLAALACGARAQQRATRWHLPAEPYDYSAIAAPAGLPGLSLPARDDPARRAEANALATLGLRPQSLRNVELTGPYMHDGRFAALDDVLKFYSHGVRQNGNLDPQLTGMDADWWSDGKSPPPPPPGPFASIVSRPPGFPMTIAQRADLLAFLKTLTDWRLVCDPRLGDPFAGRKG